MRQTETVSGLVEAERRRVGAVVEKMSVTPRAGESVAELAHDARNMVAALGLYCDLLEEPGVLARPYLHYGHELRLVAAASLRLVDRIVTLDSRVQGGPGSMPEGIRGPVGPPRSVAANRLTRDNRRWDLMPGLPIDSLAGELLANRNLLAALAGSGIVLTMDIEGGALPVRLTSEDLTRVLVNLVKNAAEVLPAGGRIRLSLRERAAGAGVDGGLASAPPDTLLLAVEDSGPGIGEHALESIFEAGFSTRSGSSAGAGWPVAHRGLGLSIARSIIEAAGGRIAAVNMAPAGARLQIELPVRRR